MKKIPAVQVIEKIEVVKPVTKEELLARIEAKVLEKTITGVGLVQYRHLSFEEHYKLQAHAEDSAEFAARAIVMGFVSPKFEEADIPMLKAGVFGAVALLGALPLERTNQSYVKEVEVVKP